MENIKTVKYLKIIRTRNICNLVSCKRGIKVADFIMPMDGQIIQDSICLNKIIDLIEWRYGLNKDKPSNSKYNMHDLYYQQVSINAYIICLREIETGRSVIIGRVLSPNDYKFEKDEVLLNAIIKILHQRINWKD